MVSAARAIWRGCLRIAGSTCASTKRQKTRRKEPLMKRVELEADQMPGQDSFLDVITNIVGILILLVLVVGLRSSRAVHSAPDQEVAEEKQASEQLQKAYTSAVSTQNNVVDLVRKVSGAHQEADFREDERIWLNTSVAKAEQEIAEQRSKLSTDGQR